MKYYQTLIRFPSSILICMNDPSFLPTSIGYIGAVSMVIGFSYYVLKEFDLSWKFIEVMGYLMLAGLFYLPYSPLVESFNLSTNLFRLTSFLALMALPIMIILTLILHVEKGDNFFLAGAFICTVTAVLSYFYGLNLHGKIICIYSVMHSWLAIQFITAQLLKNDDLRLESVLEISALMSFLFMGFGLFLYILGPDQDSIPDYKPSIYSYIVIIGLLSYLLTATARTMISNGPTDLLLIGSVVGLYYLIDTNMNSKSSFGYVEIPLSLSTAIYVFSKLVMNFFTRERFALFLILVGVFLYGLSVLYQMRFKSA